MSSEKENSNGLKTSFLTQEAKIPQIEHMDEALANFEAGIKKQPDQNNQKVEKTLQWMPNNQIKKGDAQRNEETSKKEDNQKNGTIKLQPKDSNHELSNHQTDHQTSPSLFDKQFISSNGDYEENGDTPKSSPESKLNAMRRSKSWSYFTNSESETEKWKKHFMFFNIFKDEIQGSYEQVEIIEKRIKVYNFINVPLQLEKV